MFNYTYDIHYTNDIGTSVFHCNDRLDAIAFAETLKEYSEDEDAMVVVVIRKEAN